MEEKSLTNIAKILRNAPKNIMLYCPVIGHVRFLGITNAMGFDNGIQVKNIVGTNDPVLDKYGRWTREGKCVLFPTEFAATWDNWQDELFGFGHFITDDRDKKETLVISGHDTALAYDSKGCEVTVYKPAYRWATESEIESFLAEVYKNGLEYNHNTRTFTKQEPKLPQSWEEFCNMHDVSDTEYFIDDVGGICNAIAHKAFISRSKQNDNERDFDGQTMFSKDVSTEFTYETAIETICDTTIWLLENGYIEKHEDFHPDYYACISNTETGESCIKEICALVEDETLTPKGFSSPEEVCEAAIKYCLENLI